MAKPVVKKISMDRWRNGVSACLMAQLAFQHSFAGTVGATPADLLRQEQCRSQMSAIRSNMYLCSSAWQANAQSGSNIDLRLLHCFSSHDLQSRAHLAGATSAEGGLHYGGKLGFKY